MKRFRIRRERDGTIRTVAARTARTALDAFLILSIDPPLERGEIVEIQPVDEFAADWQPFQVYFR